VFEQPGDFVTPYAPEASSVHTEVTFHPQDTFVPVASMLQVILELSVPKISIPHKATMTTDHV